MGDPRHSSVVQESMRIGERLEIVPALVQSFMALWPAGETVERHICGTSAKNLFLCALDVGAEIKAL